MVAVPLSTVEPVIGGVDATLPRVTLLRPSAVAAAPPVTTTSVPVPVAIWILPLALRVTLAERTPAAVAIAFKISDTFAALPEASPIVVLPLAVVTVVTVGSKVIV